MAAKPAYPLGGGRRAERSAGGARRRRAHQRPGGLPVRLGPDVELRADERSADGPELGGESGGSDRQMRREVRSGGPGEPADRPVALQCRGLAERFRDRRVRAAPPAPAAALAATTVTFSSLGNVTANAD